VEITRLEAYILKTTDPALTAGSPFRCHLPYEGSFAALRMTDEKASREKRKFGCGCGLTLAEKAQCLPCSRALIFSIIQSQPGDETRSTAMGNWD
jgi:hypothetical protein